MFGGGGGGMILLATLLCCVVVALFIFIDMLRVGGIVFVAVQSHYSVCLVAVCDFCIEW